MKKFSIQRFFIATGWIEVETKDGKRKVAVKVGVSNGAKTEVLSGLKEGDQVITGPFDSVRTMYVGDPVKTAPKPGTTAK